jgi:hypothetical protein
MARGSAPCVDFLSQTSDDYEREAEKYRARYDWKQCGRSMLAAAMAYPESQRHAQRLAAAALCFQKAHLVGQALKARLELIQDHPKDPLACDALFDVAAGYDQLAYYSKASCNYRDFVKACPSDKRTAKARAKAVEFLNALGGDVDDCDPTRERRIPIPHHRHRTPSR